MSVKYRSIFNQEYYYKHQIPKCVLNDRIQFTEEAIVRLSYITNHNLFIIL